MTTFALGLEHVWQVPYTTGRELQAVGGRAEVTAVGHGGHLQGTLGAVEEGVEHLGVEVAAGQLLLGEAVVVPHGVGCGVVVLGQVLGPLAGANNLETGGAGPVNHLSDERRLVTVSHGVDNASLLGTAGQQRASQYVGLHVDHDNVLLVLAAQQSVANTG